MRRRMNDDTAVRGLTKATREPRRLPTILGLRLVRGGTLLVLLVH